MIYEGIPQLANFVSDMMILVNKDGTIERNYACCDVTRNKFHRLIESKVWVMDEGAHFLNLAFDEMKNQVEEYHDKITDLYFDSLQLKPTNPLYLEAPSEKHFDKLNDMARGILSSTGEKRDLVVNKVRNKIKGLVAI
jgi:hypothetical protein